MRATLAFNWLILAVKFEGDPYRFHVIFHATLFSSIRRPDIYFAVFSLNRYLMSINTFYHNVTNDEYVFDIPI